MKSKIAPYVLAVVLFMGWIAPAMATDRYVSLYGTNDSAHGFTNWIGAATNIQYAINACSSGDVVWVTNGTYNLGGVTNFPTGSSLSNRVAITTAYVTVRSANNDPANTFIVGAKNSGTNGPAAVRCVYMTNGCSLIGFTLTNGATLSAADDNDGQGGGAYCIGSILVSNCVIIGNFAGAAGGIYCNNLISSKVYNCTIITNVAYVRGGGAYNATLNNCTIASNASPDGGGARSCNMNNCSLIGNSAIGGYGGGAGYGILSNCTLIGNSANNACGGGAYYATLYNCLLVSNWTSGGTTRGGASNCRLLANCTIANNAGGIGCDGGAGYSTNLNCIIYFNGNGNDYNANCTFSNSCSPGLSGGGNITNNPLFVSTNVGNYRLSQNSPCTNAGAIYDRIPTDVDMDGLPRTINGTVDMGAYEAAYFFSVLPPSSFTNMIMRSAATNLTVVLTNSGTFTQLYWQAVSTAGWVTLNGNGILETNGTNRITITNSAATIAGGIFTNQLMFNPTNFPFNYYPQTGRVEMSLIVAEFGRSAATISKTVGQGGSTNASLSIWNAGAGILTYTIQTNASWLAISPVTGTLTGLTADATNDISVVFTNTPLTVGTHYGTLTLISGIDGSTLNINVELTVEIGGQMLVSPCSMTNSVMMGQNLPSQVFRVANLSTQYSFGYRITNDCSWLTLSATNGSLPPLTTNEVTVSFQASGLTTNAAGSSNYHASIVITSTNADTIGSPATISVNLTVNPKARLALSKSTITNIVTAGLDPSSSTFEIWNGSGYYTLMYSISDNADWISPAPSSGTSTGEQDMITVQYSTSGFTPGTSNAVITVVSHASDGTHVDNAVDATQTVSVVLYIIPAVSLAADAAAIYNFSVRQGKTLDATTFHVWNGSSAGTLRYSIATNADWLSVRPSCGTSLGEQNTITFSCRAAGLSPGSHTATITIHGTDASTGTEVYNSPTNFIVNLSIVGGKGFDFNGDSAGACDLVVYEEITGLWKIKNLATGFTTNKIFGGSEYSPVAGDFNGDGITELGAYSYGTGHWYTRSLNNDQITIFGGSTWAGPKAASAGGFVAVPGDYDGDGKTDPTMYCEMTGLWSSYLSSQGYVYSSTIFGGPGYTAIKEDYDGDRKTDLAVYHESSAQWYVLYSSDNYRLISGTFGGPGYTAAPADYDGDGLADGCIYKEATGLWIVLPSSSLSTYGCYLPITGIFGGPGFKPVPADYTGDGLADAALYDEASGDWYIVETTGSRLAWRYRHGGYGYIPVKP